MMLLNVGFVQVARFNREREMKGRTWTLVVGRPQRPPCASMIVRLIESPIPVPLAFVVKKESKI